MPQCNYGLELVISDEFSDTMTWSEKTDLTRAWRFRCTNKKSPLNILFLMVSCLKFVWYIRFAGKTKFCCESD